jgi:DNA modification methylase
MLKRIILASSNKGDIVLDPFSGSGTTAYIAKKYERQLASAKSLAFVSSPHFFAFRD